MRLIYGIVLGSILLIIFYIEYRKTKDLFSPLCIFSVIQFLRYVPHLIYTDYEHFTELNDVSLLKTFFIELIFILMICIGYTYRIRLGKARNYHKKAADETPKYYDVEVPTLIICIIYLIGFASRIVLITKIGGISFALHNMGQAYSIYAHTSSGYLIAVGNLMTLAEIMLIHKISRSTKLLYKVLLGIMILLGMSSYLIYSSRSPALEMLMICLFAFHYLVKRVSFKTFIKPRIIAVVLSVLFVIVVLPSIRNATGNSSIEFSKLNLLEKIGDGFEGVFNEFSYVGRDTYVYEHFNESNYWFGRNYLNLFVAPIPSSIYHNKPVVDDGNYLSNIMYGYSVSPNEGRDDLKIKYSIPFSTQSCTYANFGLIGVLFAGILLGAIYRNVYSRLINDTNAFSIITYQLLLYQLELSTLSITQTLIPFIVIGLMYFFSTKLTGRKYLLEINDDSV